MQREQEALRHVKSWRITLSMSQNGMRVLDRMHEAVCPDQEHVSETVRFHPSEYIRIADRTYYRSGLGEWVEGAPSPDLLAPAPDPRPCISDISQPASQPPVGTDEMVLDIQRTIDKGSIQQGEIRKIGDRSCRDWQISGFTWRNTLGSYTMCIDIETHLPLLVESANQSVIYGFEWNVPVTIEAPSNYPE